MQTHVLESAFLVQEDKKDLLFEADFLESVASTKCVKASNHQLTDWELE
jgi:hypothetical protein